MPQKPRILIVEDDEIISGLIAGMLERRGFRVAGSARSGEEAIGKAAGLETDLVLMDVHLGGLMDGIEAARYIFQLFHLPVVFLTAGYDDDLPGRAGDAQPPGYIPKPFTDEELISGVTHALKNSAVRKDLRSGYPVGEPGTITKTPDIIIITDLRGRIIFGNPSALRFLDLPEERVLMHPWREVMLLIDDGSGGEIPDPVAGVMKMGGVPHESGMEAVSVSGGRMKAGVVIRPVRDDHGGFLGVLIHAREKAGRTKADRRG